MRWRSRPTKSNKRQRLGDAVEYALSSLGITSERVEAWLGRPCGCRARKRKLNQLDDWVTKIFSSDDANKAKEEFDKMVDDGKTSTGDTSSPEVK